MMNIVERVKRLLVSPATEWPVIASESTPTAALITGYVLPLAAVSAVASFIGNSLIGISMPMMSTTYRIPIASGLTMAVWAIVMAVAGVFLCAFIVNALAPTFGARKSDAQSLKLAAYSFTPAWVAGVLQIIPVLGVLAILGALYAIYLLYLGLQVLMQAPADKAVAYTAAVVISVFVAMFVISAIAGLLIGAGVPRAY